MSTDEGRARVEREMDGILRGGNHLASVLINRIGPSFASKYPPGTPPQDVLSALGAGDTYEVWCCWAAIMRARDVKSNERVPAFAAGVSAGADLVDEEAHSAYELGMFSIQERLETLAASIRGFAKDAGWIKSATANLDFDGEGRVSASVDSIVKSDSFRAQLRGTREIAGGAPVERVPPGFVEEPCDACGGVGQERTPHTGAGFTGRPCSTCKGTKTRWVNRGSAPKKDIPAEPGAVRVGDVWESKRSGYALTVVAVDEHGASAAFIDDIGRGAMLVSHLRATFTRRENAEPKEDIRG